MRCIACWLCACAVLAASCATVADKKTDSPLDPEQERLYKLNKALEIERLRYERIKHRLLAELHELEDEANKVSRKLLKLEGDHKLSVREIYQRYQPSEKKGQHLNKAVGRDTANQDAAQRSGNR